MDEYIHKEPAYRHETVAARALRKISTAIERQPKISDQYPKPSYPYQRPTVVKAANGTEQVEMGPKTTIAHNPIFTTIREHD